MQWPTRLNKRIGSVGRSCQQLTCVPNPRSMFSLSTLWLEACLDVVCWEGGGAQRLLGRLLLASKGPGREHHCSLVRRAGHARDPVACASHRVSGLPGLRVWCRPNCPCRVRVSSGLPGFCIAFVMRWPAPMILPPGCSGFRALSPRRPGVRVPSGLPGCCMAGALLLLSGFRVRVRVQPPGHHDGAALTATTPCLVYGAQHHDRCGRGCKAVAEDAMQASRMGPGGPSPDMCPCSGVRPHCHGRSPLP